MSLIVTLYNWKTHILQDITNYYCSSAILVCFDNFRSSYRFFLAFSNLDLSRPFWVIYCLVDLVLLCLRSTSVWETKDVFCWLVLGCSSRLLADFNTRVFNFFLLALCLWIYIYGPMLPPLGEKFRPSILCIFQLLFLSSHLTTPWIFLKKWSQSTHITKIIYTQMYLLHI